MNKQQATKNQAGEKSQMNIKTPTTLAVSRIKGFTIIELLITLVILGLLISVVAPNLNTWLNSREKASLEKQLQVTISLLPLYAKTQNASITIAKDQSFDDMPDFKVVESLKVNANGFCLGGAITHNTDDRWRYNVTSPYCKIVKVEND